MAQHRQRHRKPKGRPLDGWLIIDKPTAIGSTDVVAICKRSFQAQKCGHLSTVAELSGVADGGDQRAGGERADTGNFEQPATIGILPNLLFDPFAQRVDTRLQLLEFLVQL